MILSLRKFTAPHVCGSFLDCKNPQFLVKQVLSEAAHVFTHFLGPIYN